MKGLFLSIAATAVVVAAGAGLSAGSRSLPKGPARDAAERFVAAPGRAVLDKLEETGLKKIEKKAESKLDAERGKLEKAADSVGLDVHFASVGSWAVVGFVFCWLAVLALGVSSLKSALALGFKMTLFMIAIQAALVFTGALAWHAVKG